MNPDGTGVTNRTARYTGSDPPVFGNVRGDPEWSPDGTRITFTSDRAGQKDIWAVDAPPAAPGALLSLSTDAAWAASEPRNLTPGSGVAASSPDWRTAPPGGSGACTIEGTPGANTIDGTLATT